MAKAISWVRLDLARLGLEISRHRDDASLAEWVRNLHESLVLQMAKAGSFADELIHEAHGFREKDAERKNKDSNGNNRNPVDSNGNTRNPPTKQNRTSKTDPSKHEEQPNSIADAMDGLKDEFEKGRSAYPGSKRGRDTEFSNFKKKHKDWQSAIPKLLPAIEAQRKYKDWLDRQKVHVPQWKGFERWINGRFWEEELESQEVYFK